MKDLRDNLKDIVIPDNITKRALNGLKENIQQNVKEDMKLFKI